MEKQEVSRNTTLLGIASFLNEISSQMMFPLLPFFLTSVLLAPVAAVGLIEGLGEITTHLTGFFAGHYSDRTGRRKKMIFAGYALSGVMKGFLAVVTFWQPVLLIRFIERLGKGMRETPREALIGHSEGRDNIGTAFGYRKAWDTAGAIVGPIVATALLALLLVQGPDFAYRTVFLIAVVPAVLALIPIFFTREVDTKPSEGKLSDTVNRVMRTGDLKYFFLAGVVFALGTFSNAFFLLKSNQYLDLIWVPVAYLAYTVVYTAFALPAGALVDRLGAKKTIAIAASLFLVALCGFAFMPSAGMVFLMFGVLGLFMAIIETAPKVYLVKTADSSNYAATLGFYGAVTGSMLLPANLIAGGLWNITIMGTNASFIFSIATTLAALAVLYLKIK